MDKKELKREGNEWQHGRADKMTARNAAMNLTHYARTYVRKSDKEQGGR